MNLSTHYTNLKNAIARDKAAKVSVNKKARQRR